jgi:hypothetical protein
MASPAALAQQWRGGRTADGELIVAWQNPHTRAIAPVGLLSYVNGQYTFSYLKGASTVDCFRPLPGLPDFHQQYTAAHLFPIFAQRVMGAGRPDFARYLEVLRLAPDASPLDILGRSGGRREGDSLFLVQKPSIEDDGSSHAIFFVHGVRHIAGASERIAMLTEGDELRLQPAPDNPVNTRALLVTATDSSPLGYVPDLLVDYVHKLFEVDAPKLFVLQRNDEDSPPNMRLLIECTGRVPAGYVPFSEESMGHHLPNSSC